MFRMPYEAILRSLFVLFVALAAYGVVSTVPVLMRPQPQVTVVVDPQQPDIMKVASGRGAEVAVEVLTAQSDGSPNRTWTLDAARLLGSTGAPLRLMASRGGGLVLDGEHAWKQDPVRLVAFIPNRLGGQLLVGIVTLDQARIYRWAGFAAAVLAAGLAMMALRSATWRAIESDLLAGLARFGVWDAAGMTAAAVAATFGTCGGDLITMEWLAGVLHHGVNAYQFELQYDTISQRMAMHGLPFFPYAPLALAPFTPFVALLHPLSDWPLTLGGGVRMIGLTVWLSLALATLLYLSLLVRAGVLDLGRFRLAFWLTAANPFIFYHVCLFGQIDVYALVLLFSGLAVYFAGGPAALAAALLACSVYIKPQHMILLPATALLVLHTGWWRRGLTVLGLGGLALAVMYGSLYTTDLPRILALTSHSVRLWDGIGLANGLRLVSVVFVGFLILAAVTLLWPSGRSVRSHTIMFGALVAILVGGYQAAFLSTPGLYALMLTGWGLMAATGLGRLKLGLLAAYSFAGTVSWSLSVHGDITGVTGAYVIARKLLDSGSAHYLYNSVLYTVERAFLVLFIAAVAIAAVLLLRDRFPWLAGAPVTAPRRVEEDAPA